MPILVDALVTPVTQRRNHPIHDADPQLHLPQKHHTTVASRHAAVKGPPSTFLPFMLANFNATCLSLSTVVSFLKVVFFCHP